MAEEPRQKEEEARLNKEALALTTCKYAQSWTNECSLQVLEHTILKPCHTQATTKKLLKLHTWLVPASDWVMAGFLKGWFNETLTTSLDHMPPLVRAYLHSQPVASTHLTVWHSSFPAGNTALAKRLRALMASCNCTGRVSFRPLHYSHLIRNSPLKQHSFFGNASTIQGMLYGHTHAVDPTIVSDIFRLLLLYQHGGIWLDGDAWPLRSFAPLGDLQFGEPPYCEACTFPHAPR